MGVRFSGTFRPYIDDDGAEEISVEIRDQSGGGNLPIRIVNVHTYSEAEVREPLATIRPGRCEITFLIEDDTYASFIDDLATSIEDRFHVVLENLGYQFFAGVVVHEYIEYEDMSYPYQFTINSVDGVTRMRDIDYLDEDGEPYNDNPDGSYLSAMDHIFNCFSKLQLDKVYDTAYDIKRIWVHCNWYATNMGNKSGNPLEEVFINTDIFYDYDNDGNLIADTCWDVMEAILKAFGLTMTYGRGIYRIDQYSQRSPNAGFYWNYNFDGTPAGDRFQSWSKKIEYNISSPGRSDAYPKAIGRFSFLPPLRQVKVQYEYKLDAVATEPDEEFGFGSSFAGGTPSHKVCYLYPADHAYLAGELKDFGRFNILEEYNPLKFRVHFQLMVRTTFTGNPEDWIPHKFIIRIYLRINSYSDGSGNERYSYQRKLSVFSYSNIVPQKEEWIAGGFGSTDIAEGGYDFLTEPLLSSGSNPTTKYYDLGFETLPYADPIASRSDINAIYPYICVGLNEIVTEDGSTLSSAYTIEYAISDLTVIYAESSNRAKPTLETVDYVSSINDGGKDEKTIEVRIGDRGNTLKVNQGGTLVAPNGWGIGAGGSQELGQLLADEYHKIRGNPIRLMSRTVIGRRNKDIDLLMAFNYCDLYWLSLQTDHDHYTQEISGTWWNHTGNFSLPSGATARTRKTYAKYHRLDDWDKVNQLAGPRLEERGRAGAGFTAGDTEFVVTGWTLPDTTQYDVSDINKMLDVMIDGLKLEYIDSSPPDQTYYTINNVNNSIEVNTNWPLSARKRIHVVQNAGYYE